MAIPKIVQSITSIASAASPLTVTLPNPVNTDSVLVCLIGWNGSGGTPSAVAQGANSFSEQVTAGVTATASVWTLQFPATSQSVTITYGGGVGAGGTFPSVAVYEIAGTFQNGDGFFTLATNQDSGSSSNIEVACTGSVLPVQSTTTNAANTGTGNESTLLLALAVNDDFHPGTPTGTGSWVVDANNSATPYGQIAHSLGVPAPSPSVDFGAVSSSAKHFAVILYGVQGTPSAFIRQTVSLTLRADANSYWANQGFPHPVLSTSTIIADVAGYQLTGITGHSSATAFTKAVESVDTVTYEYYGSSVWHWENPTEATYDFTWAHNYSDMQTKTPTVTLYEVCGLKSGPLDITATQTTASPSTDLIVAATNPTNGLGLAVAACTSQGATHDTASVTGTFPGLASAPGNIWGYWLRTGHASEATYPNPGTAHAFIPSSNLLTADFLPTLGGAGNYHAVLATYLAAAQTISVDVNAIQITDYPRFYIDSSGTYTVTLSYVPGNLNASTATFTAFQSYSKTVTYQCAGSSDSLDTIWAALFSAINADEGLSLAYSSPDAIGTSGATIGGIFP